MQYSSAVDIMLIIELCDQSRLGFNVSHHRQNCRRDVFMHGLDDGNDEVLDKTESTKQLRWSL